MSKFFNELKGGLEEALAYSEKRLTLKSEFIEIPEAPKEYRANDIKKTRKSGQYSQGILPTSNL